MKRIDLGDRDYGYVTIAFQGCELRLDIWDTFENISACLRQAVENEGGDAEWYKLVGEYMQKLGYPPCSSAIAEAFVSAIKEAREEAKKLRPGEMSSASSGSTEGATPSDGAGHES